MRLTILPSGAANCDGPELLAQSQARHKALVAFGVFLTHVHQMPAALANELQESPAGIMIMLVLEYVPPLSV